MDYLALIVVLNCICYTCSLKLELTTRPDIDFDVTGDYEKNGEANDEGEINPTTELPVFNDEEYLNTTGFDIDSTTVLPLPNGGEKEIKSNKEETQCGISNPSKIFGQFGFALFENQNQSGLKTEGNPFIINGEVTNEGEFPWMAAVIKRGYYTNPKAFCGASIISEKFLLTAAHCVKNKFNESKVEIWLRSHKLIQDKRDAKAIKVVPLRFISHENFSYETVAHDIGLIELKDPIDFKATGLSPICLPSNPKETYSGKRAVAAGWGYTTPRGLASYILRKVTVPVLRQDQCKKAYGDKLFDGMICAGYRNGEKDACINDSGGPLMVESNGKHELVGIVSWGEGCALPNRPGVYTRVGDYLDWIKEKTLTDRI